MKKILLFIALISFSITQSQIVNIPDVNFKNALLNHNPIIDTNNDGEIQVSEAVNYDQDISVYYKEISDMTGIEHFINIYFLGCSNNSISILDVSQNTNLGSIFCGNNQLTTLNASNLNLTSGDGFFCNNNNLENLILDNTTINWFNCENNNLSFLDLSNTIIEFELNCSNNQIVDLDISNSVQLSGLNCSNNQIIDLDISNNYLFRKFECTNNPNLRSINLKNGNNENFSLNFRSDFENLPNLESVCVDDINSNLVSFINNEVGHSINFSDAFNCDLLNNNQILGNIKLDFNSNGCDSSDLPMPNLMLLSNNGIDNFATFTQENGDYLLYTNEGDFTTAITTILPNYYSANPNSQTNTFIGFDNTFAADFCIESNQTANDVNISLIPRIQARPGFNAIYQIVYKNVGTTQLNGNVTLEFDNTKLLFLNASETVNTQTSNTLTFNYTNLNPFETRIVDLGFNIFAPPTVNIDDILNFTATINPIAGDFTTDDNIFELNQIVIGSFDPNDITVLEGTQILLADANKYLHYVIRFQNTGTASAINVVVINDLDANLDWSTLQLESLSHNNRVAIKNGNEIEFIFENINLPDSTTDEPNSHGFIAYKIKPKTDIALGDIIPNKADIFFDFNEAIETNTATTMIVNALAVNENTLLDFSVYPTPTENILNIKSKTEIIKIEIYNKLGQLIIKNKTENKIDISNLTQGLYFVKVEDINGNFGIKKIMKK